MLCLIHKKPMPCPDCARAKAKIPQAPPPKLQAPIIAPVVPKKPVAVLNPESVPPNAVLPPKTRIEEVGGKRLLKCQYNILGCAGPQPGNWLTKGYAKCPQCTSAPGGPQFRPSLVPTAWAVCLKEIYEKKQPEFFNKDWSAKVTRAQMLGPIYDYLRGLGVSANAVSPADFLNWYDRITVGPKGPDPQYAEAPEKKALESRNPTQQQTDVLAEDFYWYWNPYCGKRFPLARVYMNLDVDKAPAVYQWVVKNIVNNIQKKDLPFGAKIAGPAKSRTDAIVLYLLSQSDADRQRAVELIAQGIGSGQIPQAAFRTPLAAFTHPAKYGNATIAGISTGAEPPLGPQGLPTKSLGTATAECIADALLEIKRNVDAKRPFPNGTLVFFLETTWQYMKREGLEHSQPV